MRLLRGTKNIYSLFSSNKVDCCVKNFDQQIKGYNYATLYTQKKIENIPKFTSHSNHEFSPLRNSKFNKSMKNAIVTNFDARYIHISQYLSNNEFSEIYNTLIPSKYYQQEEISPSEWEQIVSDIKSNSKLNDITIHSSIMKECRWKENYHLATSYVNFLKSKGQEMNLVTHGYYLLICGLNVNVCGEDRVLEVYQQLLGRVKVMDANLSEQAVIALSNTSSWQLLFKHLPVIRHMCSISVNVYSFIISAAMRNGQYDQAWEYFDEMFKKPNIHELDNVSLATEKVIQSWLIECYKEVDLQEKESKLRTLLTKLQMYHIIPSSSSTTAIKKFCQTNLGWYAKEAVIYRSGRCNSCGNKLALARIPEGEFEKLRLDFFEEALKGSDIFQATSPEEWEGFRKFVTTNAPFTHVVDALNVSLKAQGSSNRKVLLEKVLLNLTDQAGAKVLVIGRKHISKMINRVKLSIRRGASFYNLDNASKDDGFFIYAALQSGQGTKIVTSDFLRDHLARLKDPSTKRTFRFWQRSHQVYIPLGFNTQLIHPPQYNTLTHEYEENKSRKSKDKLIDSTQGWHIPIENEDAMNFLMPPKTWLCLQKSPFSSEQIENDNMKDSEQRLNVGIPDELYKIQNAIKPRQRNPNRTSKKRKEIENKPWPIYSDDDGENTYSGKKSYKNSEVMDDDYYDSDFDYTGSRKRSSRDGRTRKWSDRPKISIKVDKIFEE